MEAAQESLIKDEIRKFEQFESTVLPDLIKEENNELATVIIFVVTAVILITLLFIMAIFIDCRQEKLSQLELERKRRRILKIKVPRFAGRGVAEDRQTIVDREEQPSCSNRIV